MKVDVRVLVCFFHLLLCQILIFEKTKKYHLHGTALNANVMVVSHEQTTAHVSTNLLLGELSCFGSTKLLSEIVLRNNLLGGTGIR